MTRSLAPAAFALLALAACKPAATTPTAATVPAAPASATAAATAAAPTATVARDPKAAVQASIERFATVKSYHAVMRVEGGTRGPMRNEIDFVAPDRYRMSLQGIGTQYIVGDTMVMSLRGHTMKVPMPAGTLSRWRDPARLRENAAGMRVEAQGGEVLDGTPAQRYLVRQSQPQASEVRYWIDGNGLPLQIEVRGEAQGKPVTTTMRYSRFDDPSIRVEAPQ